MTTPSDAVLAFLLEAELEPHGILPGSSNHALLCTARLVGHEDMLVVYKPGRGERPLWDFEPGLFRREVAAFRLGRAMGWDLVPETVLRDGPFGPGAVQRFIEHDPDEHAFTLFAADVGAFRRIAAFDIVANNADRKAGHCMRDTQTGAIRIVDHGLTFHIEDKLRTVLWVFGGEALPDDVCLALTTMLAEPPALDDLLAPAEIAMMGERARTLLTTRIYPSEPDDRHGVPWPLI